MDTIADPAPFARQGPRRRGTGEWVGRLGWRGLVEYAGIYFALAIVLGQTLYPLVWLLFGSLKTKPEMIDNVWGPPANLVFQNYPDAWRIAGMGVRVLNSVMVTTIALALLVVVATPCAYALSRLRFSGRGMIIAVVVASMLIPPQVMAIPLFIVARDLGLINNRIGVAIIYSATSMPLSVFILRSFFLTLPADLEDAARVDGASRLVILTRIMLPLVRPGLALVLIFGFIEIWNDFFLAFLLLRQPQLQTIPLGLVSFFQQYDALWNLYFAALVITGLPVIAVFLLMQRQFIAGLTAGALKA
jgi:raffinose/stachyose/melibiose transport system permease protein